MPTSTSGPIIPATGNPGDVFHKTSGNDVGTYYCVSPNVWRFCGMCAADGFSTSLFKRGDGTWASPPGGSTPSGTGYVHITGGSQDAAAQLVPTADITGLATVATSGAYADLSGKPALGNLAALNTVNTAQIDNDAVTYAKVQNVTSARLLGRATAGSGDVEEITLGTNLSFAGTTLNAAGGGGESGQLAVTLLTGAAATTWTNMPAAVTFFNGSHRFATKVDLTNYTQCRLIVNKQSTAGAASSVIRLRYITAFNTTVGNWLTIGASEVQVAVNVQNTVLDSGWINLVAGAQADVFITLDGSGGDGVIDPTFGTIVAEFK